MAKARPALDAFSMHDPQHARRFALDVVRRLRAAGFQALWAGGCVRDDLLGRTPKDFDVATDATPDQVRAVFGPRRTLAVGQAFGVICVLGPKPAGQVDVATFRRDATYSDGRRPDHVTFSTAEDDAQRRDFTINGLFYDPLEERIIDYVGGREDLDRKLVRAIGDPRKRFAEDKLRMLRAVRIATIFGFQIEPATLHAIQQHAEELSVVSAERIAAELQRMLEHDQRRRGAQLLQRSRLLAIIFPELAAPESDAGSSSDAGWLQTLEILHRLDRPAFSTALAALLRPLVVPGARDLKVVEEICQRLRLGNQHRREIRFLLAHESAIRGAARVPWPRLQRILVQPESAQLMVYGQAVAEVLDGGADAIDFCRHKLSLPRAQWDPPPLIRGDDLRALGPSPGPQYAVVLEAIRDAQLEGRLATRAAALQMASELFAKLTEP